jgi:hypothetical protein
LALADQRLRYLGRRWYDLVVILLPLLRPLQLLRLIPLLSVLSRRAQTGLRGRVAVYVAGGASLLAFVAAIAVLDVERSSPDANINGFGDAIWWAVTTMTTVGYGDHYPVTGIGRAVGFGLMLGGIALLGTVTATLASWLVESVAAEKGSRQRIYRPWSGDLRRRSIYSHPRRNPTSTPVRQAPPPLAGWPQAQPSPQSKRVLHVYCTTFDDSKIKPPLTRPLSPPVASTRACGGTGCPRQQSYPAGHELFRASPLELPVNPLEPAVRRRRPRG